MSNIKKLQDKVNEIYKEAFVNTPLTKRLDDINKECRELCNYSDIKNLKEEASDLLGTLIQLHNECGWDLEKSILNNVAKIKRRLPQYKSLGRKINVAILGGAFNPPTVAHLEVAKFILNTSRWADEVWLMPANGHMDNKQMKAPEHRIEMCKILTSNDGRIKVSDYEIKNKLGGETYHMLNKLVHDDEYENYRFAFIIGQDRANTIDTWYNSEELLKMNIPFIIIPRKGVERDKNVNWYLHEPHMYIIDEDKNEVPDYSSTMARNALKTDPLNAIKILSKDVYYYIQKNNLKF